METEINRHEEREEPEPKIIGLTGGIGSGKTTVAQWIEVRGYPVYYSDIRAKTIVNEDENLRREIILLLGAEAYDEEGNYNRIFVSSQVFKNKDLLNSLNGLIHPAVKLDFDKWIDNQNSPYIFKETALLFELNLDKECYKSVLVTAEDNLRIKRVMERDQKTYREVEEIMNKQMPEKEKIRKADFVLFNNEDLDELKSQVQALLMEFDAGNV